MKEAAIPNPALEPFGFLIGRWVTEARHPYFPDRIFAAEATFEWMFGGAFLMMKTGGEDPEIPSAIALFGSDDATGDYFMLYFDARGVSRKYDVSVEAGKVEWWRDAPGFSQRFTLSAIDDQRMKGSGEMSRDGGAWEPDLQLSYARRDKLD